MRKDFGVNTVPTDKPKSSPAPDDPPKRAHNGRRIWWISGAIVVVVIGLIVAVVAGLSSAEAPGDAPVVYTVEREPLIVSVDQTGQIEAARKEIIRSEVRDTVEIKWMVEEGAIVEEGDDLVKMDTTKLEDKLIDAEQQYDNAHSSYIAAEVTLQNTESQSKSDIEKAELDYEFAKLALEKYLQGEYPQELKQAQASVEIATETYERNRAEAEGSQRLYERGFITESEKDADLAAANKAKLDLEVAQGKLELLKKYTFYQQKRKLTSDVDQAEAALERVKNRAKADLEKAKAELGNRLANLNRAKRDVEERKEDRDNAVITAPVAGRVVYAPQGHRWRRKEPLAVGSDVRNGQEIIHLPESGAMIVAIKIDESQRDKVAVGMPVRITIPSLPDQEYRGELVKVAEYLDPSGWWNNNMQVYSASVQIRGRVDPETGRLVNDLEELRTGMNCQTQIIVAQYNDVLTVPLQAVTKVGQQHMVYQPAGRDRLNPVPIDIGLDNGAKVHVISGLSEGDRVVLTPPLAPAAKTDKPAALIDDQPETDKDTARQDTSADDAAPADAPTPDTPSGDQTTGQPTNDNPRQAEADAETDGEVVDDRTARMLRLGREAGLLTRMDLPEPAVSKINSALDAAGESGPIRLDAQTARQLRSAMRKLREQRENSGDRPERGERGERGRGSGSGRPGGVSR